MAFGGPVLVVGEFRPQLYPELVCDWLGGLYSSSHCGRVHHGGAESMSFSCEIFTDGPGLIVAALGETEACLRASDHAIDVAPAFAVTDGIATLAGLLDRYERLRAELAAVATDAGDVLADLTDPATVEREIAEIQRDATLRITAAEQAKADAEKASTQMARRLEHAVELEELALAAADEANTKMQEAATRLEQVEQEAARRIAKAETERERVHAEAETVLIEMHGHVDAARAAQVRAEGERDTAVANANAVNEQNRHLRAQLDNERAELRQQIERRDTEYARAITAAHAMADRAAREHREQLTEVMQHYAGQPHRVPVRAAGEAPDPMVGAEPSPD